MPIFGAKIGAEVLVPKFIRAEVRLPEKNLSACMVS